MVTSSVGHDCHDPGEEGGEEGGGVEGGVDGGADGGGVEGGTVGGGVDGGAEGGGVEGGTVGGGVDGGADGGGVEGGVAGGVDGDGTLMPNTSIEEGSMVTVSLVWLWALANRMTLVAVTVEVVRSCSQSPPHVWAKFPPLSQPPTRTSASVPISTNPV